MRRDSTTKQKSRREKIEGYLENCVLKAKEQRFKEKKVAGRSKNFSSSSFTRNFSYLR